ncbi:FixH family protein [Mucilaginibacter antarcticus]|uniref:FixH family protein n=1 Tax=Mucilaginibacter antarcticus TaxID=1855725 RepID=A0ABW5XTD4_9SPHI
MNWGKGIIGGMIIFMLFIISMCVYMFSVPADEYDEKYYEKGLNYDQDYNRAKQVIKDKAEPKIEADSCCIEITFQQTIIGQVKLTRPSSNIADKIIAINNKNGQPVQILTANMPKGKWQLTFEWISNNKAYLYQKEVYLDK